ncbi:MAG: hypothetical protein ACI4UM_05340 [Succinivibrio sp.]
MKRVLELFSLVMLTITLTGCVNTATSSIIPSVESIKENIVDSGNTVEEARAKLGTPALIATAKDGSQIMAFSICTGFHRNFGRNVGKSLVTLGLGSKTHPFVVKTSYITFKEGRAANAEFMGWSYITKNRFTFWNEAEHVLSEEELNTPLNLSIDDIYELYCKDVSAKMNIPVNEISSDIREKEFPFINVHGHIINGFYQNHKQELFESIVYDPKAEPGDGSRFKEFFRF